MQLCYPPEIGIVGSYHGANLGDLALGYAVRKVLAEQSVRTGLQSAHNLKRWPKTPRIIVGGGAVATDQLLTTLAQRYDGHGERVSLLGVDFVGPIKSEEARRLIQQANVISTRFPNSKSEFEAKYNRTIHTCSHDLSFAHFTKSNYGKKANLPESAIGVNIVGIQSHIRGNHLELQDEYQEASDVAHRSQGAAIFSGYREYFRNVTQQCLAQGKRVYHLPFTPLDVQHAKIILEGLDVSHLPYSPNTDKALMRMRNFEAFYSTRFHALVFALICGIPVIPYCYAWKCRNLLLNLGVEGYDKLHPESFIEQPTKECIDWALSQEGLLISPEKLSQIRAEVIEMINGAFGSSQSSAGA